MRGFTAEGIVIKRRNSGEADKFLTVFTKYHGKIQVKANGVRKITSKRAAHIELLNHVQMHLYPGARYPILTEVVSLNDFSAIKNDFQTIGTAYHLCELIDGLCPENEIHTDIFLLLEQTLRQFSALSQKQIVADFEIVLLTKLGYWRETGSSLQQLDTQRFIENILERKLKSKRIFTKMEE